MRKLKDVEYADCRKHNACDHRNNRGQEQADKQFVGILFTCFFVKDGILRKHAGAAGGGRAVSRKEGGDGNTADNRTVADVRESFHDARHRGNHSGHNHTGGGTEPRENAGSKRDDGVDGMRTHHGSEAIHQQINAAKRFDNSHEHAHATNEDIGAPGHDLDGSLIVRYAKDDENNGGKRRSKANVDAEGKHDNHHSGTGHKSKLLLLVELGQILEHLKFFSVGLVKLVDKIEREN